MGQSKRHFDTRMEEYQKTISTFYFSNLRYTTVINFFVSVSRLKPIPFAHSKNWQIPTCFSRLITKVLITLSNVLVSYTETIFKDYE